MLSFVVILGGSLVVGVAVYGILQSTGVLPSLGETTRDTSRDRAPYSSSPLAEGRVPHLRELPQGCLVAIILAGLLWFGMWGLVLYLALRFLNSPFAN